VKGLAKPWFPAVLDAQRKLDFQLYPERYAHIREGEYARAEQARQQVGSITLRLIPYYRRRRVPEAQLVPRPGSRA
jgi:hypothetical protein